MGHRRSRDRVPCASALAVYAGLGGAFFLVVLRLQLSLGYSALEVGSALVPFTVIMLLLFPAAGQLGQRVGALVALALVRRTAAVEPAALPGILHSCHDPAVVRRSTSTAPSRE